jgi:hypothetical protein
MSAALLADGDAGVNHVEDAAAQGLSRFIDASFDELGADSCLAREFAGGRDRAGREVNARDQGAQPGPGQCVQATRSSHHARLSRIRSSSSTVQSRRVC